MKKVNCLVLITLVVVLFSGIAMAADSADNEAPKAKEHDLEAIGKQTNNPVGAAWMLWFQNDYTRMGGDAVDGHEYWNSTKFQPVMSFPFEMANDPWNLIFRPVFQLQSFSFDGDRTTGLGDTGLAVAIGPDRLDGIIWGLGVTQLFPTASDDAIGQEKWQAGPAVLLAHLAPKPGGFNIGIFGQHWWSYAGDDDRADTSLTDIQYFIQYRLSKTENVGMGPNIQYDWKADSDNALTLPIGLGYSKVTTIGNLPVKFQLEFQYNVVKPDDFGADWNIRFLFIPIISSPFHAD